MCPFTRVPFWAPIFVPHPGGAAARAGPPAAVAPAAGSPKGPQGRGQASPVLLVGSELVSARDAGKKNGMILIKLDVVVSLKGSNSWVHSISHSLPIAPS